MQSPFRPQPQRIGDLFDAGFRLFRAHITPLVALALIGALPMLLAQAALNNWLFARLGVSISMVWLISFATNLVIALLLGPFANAALVAALAQAYLGRPPVIGVALRAALQRYPLLLLASIVPVLIERMMSWMVSILQAPLTSLAIGGGLSSPAGGMLTVLLGALLLLPIIVGLLWLYGQLFLYIQVVMFEQAGPLAALGRSWQLTRGQRWRAALLVLGTRLLAQFFTWLPWLFTTFVFFRLQSARELFSAAAMVVSLLGVLIALPLVLAIHTVFYYALRTHGEGYDLEQRLPML